MKIQALLDEETRTRVLTGFVGGALLLGLVLLGGYWGVAILSAILGAAICLEMAKVFYNLPDKKEKTRTLLGISWLMVFANVLSPKSILECLLFSFLGLFSYFLLTAERYNPKTDVNPERFRKHFDEFIATIFILVYVVSFLSFLPMIRDGSGGSKWVLVFLFIVWAGDTGAYFVGRKYGKTKLYPFISPGKSVEGALGGLASSLVVTILFKLLFFKGMGILAMLITPILVGIMAQVGDLCESFFKRAYGLKDSGSILPGHGGMLDRFDGVLFSIPVMYVCVKLFSS